MAESLPKDINGVQDYPKITRALLERGYSENDILKYSKKFYAGIQCQQQKLKTGVANHRL